MLQIFYLDLPKATIALVTRYSLLVTYLAAPPTVLTKYKVRRG